MRSSSKSSSSSAAGSSTPRSARSVLKAVDGLLVEVVLEHELIELGGLDLAALLRLCGERVQCRNFDDAGLQRFLVSLSAARHRRARAVCGVS